LLEGSARRERLGRVQVTGQRVVGIDSDRRWASRFAGKHTRLAGAVKAAACEVKPFFRAVKPFFRSGETIPKH